MIRTASPHRLVPVLLLGCLLTSPVFAADVALGHINDQQYAGRGTDPIPLKPTKLVLRSAEVVLDQIPVKDGWQVTADYEMFNPGTAAESASLLIAEDRCQKGRGCSPNEGAFAELGARFGQELLKAVTAPAEAMRPFAEHPGDGSVYQVSVQPKQARRLSLEYLLDQSHGSQYWGVQYLSSAGRWAGVEKVRYVITLKYGVPYVLYPRAFKLEEFSERANSDGAGSVLKMVFTAERLAARSDFVAIFPEDALIGRTASGPCQGFRGDLTDEELALALKGYDGKRLRECSDLVLALHGYPFKTAALRTRYHGTPSLPAWVDSKVLAVAVRPETHPFREGLLSPGEQSYVRALTAAEKRQKK